MFVVSHVMIIAFHPELKLNRIIVERSFAHSFQKLTTIDYFTNDQMNFVDIKVIKQLKDAAGNVCNKKDKNAVAHMFSIELYLLKQTLMSWFNRKIKSQNVELSNKVKYMYGANNPIKWETDVNFH